MKRLRGGSDRSFAVETVTTAGPYNGTTDDLQAAAQVVATIGSPSPSANNTTTTPLAGAATFTGEWDTNGYPDVMVSCQSDVAGTLYFDFSNDAGSNYTTFPAAGFAVDAGIHEFHNALKGARSFRVRYINGSGAQTYLRLYTYYGTFRQANAPLSARISQDADAIVTRTDSEDAVMRGKVSGEHIIAKFARNPDVDAAEDIWHGGGDYTGFPTSAAEEFQVLSSDIADAAAGTGARTVRFYYLDADYNAFDANGEFLYFDATLNGTTAVNSGVTGMRIWRGSVLTSGAGLINAGDISCRWRTTTTAVFAVLPATFGQTQISNFTIPAGYTGYLKAYRASMDDNTANSAQMGIKARSFGSNTMRILRPFIITTSSPVEVALYGGETFSEKTDFVFRAISVVNANAIINASWEMRLVKN